MSSATAASTVGAFDRSGTEAAVRVWCSPSLVVGRGLAVRQDALDGSLTAQAGSSTRRSREAYAPPKAPANAP
ncbi:hypothetical protein [Streptomyces kasugaensis]|uniref:hypothetical protein n=1 Tax=Streptomyces kasugaensis TaxID=1946 RepID=UPI001559BEDF|nr:hypothetical protein [Streptomyces kasugaensis]